MKRMMTISGSYLGSYLGCDCLLKIMQSEGGILERLRGMYKNQDNSKTIECCIPALLPQNNCEENKGKFVDGDDNFMKDECMAALFEDVHGESTWLTQFVEEYQLKPGTKVA